MPNNKVSKTQENKEAIDRLQDIFAGSVAITSEGDSDEMILAMAQRILDNQDDVDAILGGSEVIHAKDILDTPLTIREVTFNKGDFADGAGVYAVVVAHTLVNPDDVVTITCGGTNVCAQLLALQKGGHLPMVGIQFVEAPRPTKNGYYPLWLRKVKVSPAVAGVVTTANTVDKDGQDF